MTSAYGSPALRQSSVNVPVPEMAANGPPAGIGLVFGCLGAAAGA